MQGSPCLAGLVVLACTAHSTALNIALVPWTLSPGPSIMRHTSVCHALLRSVPTKCPAGTYTSASGKAVCTK